MHRRITINRAPVLTLWAAVVAERLGFDHDKALTSGKTVVGLNAYAKGVRLGIYEPTPADVAEQRKKLRHGEELRVSLLGRAVPVTRTPEGLRALGRNKPVTPQSVERYLTSKFGADLEAATRAMKHLANAFRPEDLAARAFHLYEEFRPKIPEGISGWGARGSLDLDAIEALAK